MRLKRLKVRIQHLLGHPRSRGFCHCSNNMRPFVQDKLGKRCKLVNDPTLATRFRKLVARKKVESRREKRKADKKELRDEWGF